MTELTIEGLVRRHGSVVALDGIDLAVERGSFVTLLGPSGCGKSTTLMAIAGLDRPDEGRIRFRDRTLIDVGAGTFVPAEKRDFGVVFQSYALWPHMTVRRNIDLSLRLRGVGRAERDRRTEEVLGLVGLAGMAERYPAQLSGGQQQRVALARALVYQPPLLLLDEPLSNLDAQLRDRARIWLKEIQTRLGITARYVTHDQGEALALSDRIAVMKSGRIVQFGTPREIYEAPAHPFVAEFVGASNFLVGRVSASTAERLELTLPDGQTVAAQPAARLVPGAEATVAVRAERLSVAPAPGGSTLAVVFGTSIYLGDRWQQQVTVAGQSLHVALAAPQPAGPGRLSFPLEAGIGFPGILSAPDASPAAAA
jgi:iron(III) transport system ATP-binding protein